jgi:L-alanine-DL-glutamate epimerase-like enolase superfamily enzyme
MRIERLEVVPYALRFEAPYQTARGRLEQRELVLVRLHGGGLTGLGETASLSLRGGAPVTAIARELAEQGAALVEGALVEAEGWRLLAGELASAHLSRQARAALELALLDLAGKLAGQPAWRLLGAKAARPVECNATLVAGETEAVVRDALAWDERGFRTFKLKAGVDGDVDHVEGVRAALGGDARLRVDANGAWEVDEAVAKLRRMAPLELAEQPVATLGEMAELRLRTGVALAADESVESPQQARDAAASCDATTVKLAKVGGPLAALEISRWLPVYVSSALDGPVGIAAAAHVAQALPDAGLAHGLATSLLFSEAIGSGAELDGPLLGVPDDPGLGVEIDERALERHRI